MGISKKAIVIAVFQALCFIGGYLFSKMCLH